MKHWVLLKGIRQDARHWRDIPERLAQRTGGKVMALELPGSGASHAQPSPLRVQDIIASLHPQLPDDPPGTWGIVGLSLGGMVALAWAARSPVFGAVVVGNSSASGLSPGWQRMRPAALAAVVRAATTRDPIAREEKALHVVSALPTHARRAIAAHHARWQEDAPFTRSNLVRQIVAGARFRLTHPPPCPTLVLNGAADRFVDPRCSARLAAWLRAPLHVHPSAGHDLTLDAPEWLIDEIVAFGEATGRRATPSRS